MRIALGACAIVLVLACYRYIELNPVRARMVDHPRRYGWSSYRAHAEGRSDPLVADHPVFRRLGRSHAERLANYRGLFREALDESFVMALRAATNGGCFPRRTPQCRDQSRH